MMWVLFAQAVSLFMFPPFLSHLSVIMSGTGGESVMSLKKSVRTERKTISLGFTKCLQMGNTMDDWQGSRNKKKSCKIDEKMKEIEAEKCARCRLQRQRGHQHVEIYSRLCETMSCTLRE